MHGEKAVDVGVVQPENGVESSDIEEGHVPTVSTSSSVDLVVNGLEAVSVAAVGAGTQRGGAGATPVGLTREERIDTLAPCDLGLSEHDVHLIIVVLGAFGTTDGNRGVVDRARAYLGRQCSAEAVRVERVRDGDGSTGLGDGDGPVANGGGHGGLAGSRVRGPVEVGRAEADECVPPPLLLVGGEAGDHFGRVHVKGLLEDGKVRPMPRAEERVAVRAVSSLVEEGALVVPRNVGTSVNTYTSQY